MLEHDKEKNIKYTIANVQQDKLLKAGLDLKDAYILTYLRDIVANGKIVKKKVENEFYYWIKIDKVLEYLPALKISNLKVLGRRFKNYEEKGLIARHLHKNPLKGSYLFIKPLEKFRNMFEISKQDTSLEELKTEYKELGIPFCGEDNFLGTQKLPQKEKIQTNKTNNNTLFSRGNSKVTSSELKSDFIGTQKYPDNTSIKNSKINNTIAEPVMEFEKELKYELEKISLLGINRNTIYNIKKYSFEDIEIVKKAISYMVKSKKISKASTLVAILRDKDYLVKNSKVSKLGRKEKVEFMKEKFGEEKIIEMKMKIIKTNGFEIGAETELETVLCLLYNKEYAS